MRCTYQSDSECMTSQQYNHYQLKNCPLYTMVPLQNILLLFHNQVSHLDIVWYFSVLKQGYSTDLVVHIQVGKLKRRIENGQTDAEEVEISSLESLVWVKLEIC